MSGSDRESFDGRKAFRKTSKVKQKKPMLKWNATVSNEESSLVLDTQARKEEKYRTCLQRNQAGVC